MSVERTHTRKTGPVPQPATGCPVGEGADGVWQVRGHETARALLRSSETLQAGLGIETARIIPSSVRRPVLYQDGEGHRDHRRQTARFFTPRRVDEEYRGTMERVAEEQLDVLRARRTAELSDLSFELAIGVAAAVIGLTESRPGIRKRLDAFFPQNFGTPGFTSLHGLRWSARLVKNWLRLHLADVRPAVRARRKHRRDDLISHLLDEDYNTVEILSECLTFAAAGMITTREFVNVAAWHLFDDPKLLARYRRADEPERLAVLHEILRLEPVVNLLRRRTTAPVALPAEEGEVTVPAGALVDIRLDSANTDPRAVGDAPHDLCPARPLPSGTAPTGLSFGDGPHRCPGRDIAILETDVFLTRLFALPGLRMSSAPDVSFKPSIGSYELRGLAVELEGT
ncbi:cytochrome P450 [Streptomyces xiaopingdaonensis]|uniref:cytochrome P450 n=1 Tax=Streptomyces xiaopingdaonensis TaxID=1565415 RepID=UPI0002FAF0E5|nr:cytochrome P450 [Streptomyces xiaopingdaonensis]